MAVLPPLKKGGEKGYCLSLNCKYIFLALSFLLSAFSFSLFKQFIYSNLLLSIKKKVFDV